MKTNELKQILMRNLYKKSRGLFCTNFKSLGFQECDIIRITESGMVYEYEVKISLQDFKADFKKEYKHNRYSGKIDKDQKYIEWCGHPSRPNYFYYTCPEGLISLNLIPEYAGLIYVNNNNYKVVKKAPKLHSFKATDKLKLSIANILSNRFIFGGCSYINFDTNIF